MLYVQVAPVLALLGLVFLAVPSVALQRDAAPLVGGHQTRPESAARLVSQARLPAGFLQKPKGGAARKGNGEEETEAERVRPSKWPMWLKLVALACAATVLVVFFGCVLSVLCSMWGHYSGVRAYHERAGDGFARKFSFWGYVKYRFAYWFAWTEGANAIIIAILVFLSLLVGATVYCWIVGARILSSIWITFVWLVAPDAGVGELTHKGCFIGALMSIVGLVLFALLLTLMQDSFGTYLDQIRNGSSCVMETGHMLLIGITENTMPIIAELCKAYEVSGGTTIVVLSGTLSKPDMECRITKMGIELFGSRIVVRAGKATCNADLRIVSADSARSIVIMADRDQPKEMRDAFVMRALMGLRGKGWPTNGRILAVCSLIRNKPLFEQAGASTTDVVMLDRFVGKLMVQCSKYQGLGTIVKHTFGFDGSEFYITPIPDYLMGKTVASAALHYPFAVVCGVIRPEGAGCKLCPGYDYTLKAGEELVLLATDSACVAAQKEPAKPPKAEHLSRYHRSLGSSPSQRSQGKPEKILIMGWNEKIGYIILELDNIVQPGTEVILVSPKPMDERNEEFDITSNLSFKQRLENITIRQVQGRLGSRHMLEELPGNAVAEASRIFILGDDHACGPLDADTATISILLQLRDILVDSNTARGGPGLASKIPIIPEIQDPDSETHCQMIQASDFIDTSWLPSQAMAMIAYNPQIALVFEEILSESNSAEFAIRSLREYIQPGTEPPLSINFVQVQYLAGKSGDVVVGWSLASTEDEDPPKNKGFKYEFQRAMQDQATCSGSVPDWEINPEDKHAERVWDGERDKLVVLCSQRP